MPGGAPCRKPLHLDFGEATQVVDSSADLEPAVDVDTLVDAPSAAISHGVPPASVPSVSAANGEAAAAAAAIPSRALQSLLQLLNQIVQHQAQMQQQLSDICDSLGRGSSAALSVQA